LVVNLNTVYLTIARRFRRIFKSVSSELNVDLRRNIRKMVLSISDQAFSIGTIFLVNVFLARFQSKDAYGMFVLTYSVFTLLSGIHNALVLEPFTVYASGQYRKVFTDYFSFTFRANTLISLLLVGIVMLVILGLLLFAPSFLDKSLIGLSLALFPLFTVSFVRRSLYVRGQYKLALFMSLVFF